ncbi:DUF3592 domain-containing protein [Streptomyces sp. NPDC046821]|uniref:DUF3592 domain-containing protein n=1 Tax=Streptomyces sp. NPDC046821 TaxID=3154702 RepID=UPI0033E58B76
MRVQGNRRAGRLATIVLIGVGAVFLIVGLSMAGVSISYLSDAERAPGKVVSLEWRRDYSSSRRHGSDGPMAYPVVQFTSADGKLRTFHSSMGSNPPAYDVGERVEMLYRADSPQDAKISGFFSLWLFPVIFGGIGLLVTGIGTAVAIVTRRRSRS